MLPPSDRDSSLLSPVGVDVPSPSHPVRSHRSHMASQGKPAHPVLHIHAQARYWDALTKPKHPSRDGNAPGMRHAVQLSGVRWAKGLSPPPGDEAETAERERQHPSRPVQSSVPVYRYQVSFQSMLLRSSSNILISCKEQVFEGDFC